MSEKDFSEKYNKINFDDFINLNNEVDKKNFDNYKRILEKQGDKLSLNIFKLISDSWYRENFHSDVLCELLKKNITTVESLLKFVNVDQTPYKGYTIEKEVGRVDLAIIGDGHVVAIENKIYWAPDRPKQLYRYFNYLTDTRKLKVDAIIYITPSKDKQPSKNSLGFDSDEKVAKKVEALTKNLVGFDGGKKDLVSILESSLAYINEKDDNDKTFYVLTKNYIDILKETGVGDMTICKETFLEELIQKAKTDDDFGNKLEYLTDMLTDFSETRLNYWCSKLKKRKFEKKLFCEKAYKITGVSFTVQIDCSAITKTKIWIGNKRGDAKAFNKFQKPITEELDKYGYKLDKDDGFNYLSKTFDFPKEEELAEKEILKLDEQLTKWVEEGKIQ